MVNIADLPEDIQGQVKKCASLILAGGIVAYPTDTVYGLGADIYNHKAVNKIFSVKRRPLSLPLPVLIADMSQLSRLAADIPPAAARLMAKFWPGALTIVFDRAADFDSPTLSGGNKIAVRMPGHAITLRLIKEVGRPIVGTSANLHGQPVALTAAEVGRQLGASIDFILDGGRCPGGVESTVVDITAAPPTILREGTISEKEILHLLNLAG